MSGSGAILRIPIEACTTVASRQQLSTNLRTCICFDAERQVYRKQMRTALRIQAIGIGDAFRNTLARVQYTDLIHREQR